MVVVCCALSWDDKIVLRVPEYNEIGQYAPGERVTIDVDGMTSLGCQQAVRVSGRAVVLPDPSVGALNGWGGESWPAGITMSTVAFPLEQVHGFDKAERSTGGKEPGQ